MNRVISKLLPLAALLVLPMMAQAQDTSSAMRGRILDEAGAPVAGASVVVEDLRTGVQRNYQSNNTGTFLAARLPVGGPYRVTVNNSQSVDVPSIAVGDTYNLTVTLLPPMEEIIALGTPQQFIETAPGPSATFGLQDLDSAVAFNRDIKDVYSIDPRLNLDGFEINCAGKHPRFNAITLDGVSHSDRFGLNTNGYSTATGMPFPFDAIQQVSVELAPFDTKYGGFSACNINAVTKSGSNEWEANAFYEYTTESLRESKLDDLNLDLSGEDFKETTQGFSLGGPIIKDKLFFFVAYEETEEPRFLAAGYNGSGNGEERPWLSQQDYQRVLDIAQNIYGFDPGAQGKDGAQTSENYLVRLDWNINDNHNVAAIYNDYDGVQSRSSDSDPFEFEFSNHFYDKGSVSETYTLILDSQWTDSFSTQLYYTDTRMDDSQVTVGPKDIGDHQINVNGFDNIIYLGADDSRQANKLYTDSKLLKLSGQFLVGDHVITAGYETEELEVFNIFVQHSRGGEWDYRDSSFGNNDPNCSPLTAQQRYDNTVVADSDGDLTNDDCQPTGIDHFELGRPYRVYYGSGGGTNDPNDAAANFINTQNAMYIQDEIYFAEQDLTLTAGLRYEWIDSNDSPTYNSTLSNAVGVRNDSGLDGVDILMPRLGFTWGVREDLKLRGGVGLYSGGNPNVWLGNAWSRDGITNVQVREDYFHNLSIFDGGIPTIPGPVGGAIPQVLFDEVAAVSGDAGSDSFNNLIDPDYEAPQEWKVALGGTWDMPWWGITADFDYMYTRLEKGAIYVDLSQEHLPGNNTLAGAPIYTAVPGAGEGNLMLTNARADGDGNVFSLLFKKDFDWGLDLMLGYAHTNVKDAGPMASFTGESSYSNVATNDINYPRAATGNYNVKSRVTLRASFAREFWGDNTTRFTLMGYYGSGQPGTYTMTSDDVLQVGFSSRHLLYVPDGPNDPNVIFDPEFDQAAFFDWAKKRGLKRGGFVTRNSQESKANGRIDLRIDQEIPLGMDDLKARAYLKIYNFTNMLNNDWGRVYDAGFSSQGVVDVSLDPSGAYVFEDFDRDDITDLESFDSLWQMRLGIEVNFR